MLNKKFYRQNFIRKYFILQLNIDSSSCSWIKIRVCFHFWLQVKLCNGKLVTITACEKGFYSSSRPSIHSHSLVTLLSRLSKSFADVCVPPSLSIQTWISGQRGRSLHIFSVVLICIWRVFFSSPNYKKGWIQTFF